MTRYPLIKITDIHSAGAAAKERYKCRFKMIRRIPAPPVIPRCAILRVWLLITFQSTSAVHGRPRFERRFSCCIRPLTVVRPRVEVFPNPKMRLKLRWSCYGFGSTVNRGAGLRGGLGPGPLKQLFWSVLHFLCGLIIAHRERFVVE